MLTPQDIKEKSFKKSFIGYSATEVNECLREISDSYEKLWKENIAATERIAMLSDAVKQYKIMEESLQSAIGIAENNGALIHKNAQEKAEVIIKEAEAKAAEILSRANAEEVKIVYGYEQLKRDAEVFRARMVALLNAQLDIIKEYSEIDSIEYKKNSSLVKDWKENTEEIPVVKPDDDRNK